MKRDNYVDLKEGVLEHLQVKYKRKRMFKLMTKTFFKKAKGTVSYEKDYWGAVYNSPDAYILAQLQMGAVMSGLDVEVTAEGVKVTVPEI